MGKVTLAVVQAATVPFDAEAATAKCVGLLAEAAGKGAKLVVFPEAFIGGYPKGLDFGCCIGRRTPEGRDDFRRYVEGAIAVPGPETEQLVEACAEADVHAVVGVIERDGGTIYCTALYLGPQGLLGKHRKVMPTGSDRGRHPLWHARRRHLLGKLHADAAHGDVRQGRRAVGRADCR